jgi:hypothetical protein
MIRGRHVVPGWPGRPSLTRFKKKLLDSKGDPIRAALRGGQRLTRQDDPRQSPWPTIPISRTRNGYALLPALILQYADERRVMLGQVDVEDLAEPTRQMATSSRPGPLTGETAFPS